jgi:flagellar biosynthesis protein FlhF
MDEMLRMLREVREAAAPAPRVPASVRHLYQELRRHEVEAALARRLVLGLPKNTPGSGGAARARLRTLLGRRFQVRRAGAARAGQRLVALVGPTGVGKTTTIAKLAGQCRAQGGLRMALMSLDTYRIGAVAQMRIYAELLRVPFHAVDTPEALESALDAERDADLILVDTTGRSPGRPTEIEALSALLRRIPGVEVHLVVSATTKASDLEEVLVRFRPLAYRHVVITKLDEARTAGPVLGLALERGLSISYLTAGQEVPDDLERATPTRLSALLIPDPPTRRSRRQARS